MSEEYKRNEMLFSKAAFLRSTSGKSVRHLLAAHLDILNGLAVTATGGSFGTVKYSVDGEDFYLYPVMPEWCAETVTKEKEKNE